MSLNVRGRLLTLFTVVARIAARGSAGGIEIQTMLLLKWELE